MLMVQPAASFRNTHSSSQLAVGCTASASALPSRLSVCEAGHTTAYVQRFASGLCASCLSSISATQVSPGSPALVTTVGFLGAIVPAGNAAQREALVRIAATLY